ncbi:MAG TPA: hypothetical protein VF698_13995 [Thermoanaerobaculia bacterium]
MEKLIGRSAAVVILIVTLGAGTALAASPSEFYLNLLRRGIASLAQGKNDAAARELRIAAFGLLEAVDRFQVAEIHLAIASDRLKNEADARAAAQRVVAAERVRASYAALDLPQDTRAAFETIATRLLPSDQLAVLHNPVAAPAPAPVIATNGANRQTTPAPVPVPQPRVVPPAPQPARPATGTAAATPPPHTTTPAPVPAPHAVTPPTAPATAARDLSAAIASGERALAANNLAQARTIYREALERAPDDHALLIRIAEGLYRARDFANVVKVFNRIGPLRRGEEPYRYYLAVALYETGDSRAAKRELRAALPFIEETADVTRYRARIEGAID